MTLNRLAALEEKMTRLEKEVDRLAEHRRILLSALVDLVERSDRPALPHACPGFDCATCVRPSLFDAQAAIRTATLHQFEVSFPCPFCGEAPITIRFEAGNPLSDDPIEAPQVTEASGCAHVLSPPDRLMLDRAIRQALLDAADAEERGKT